MEYFGGLSNIGWMMFLGENNLQYLSVHTHRKPIVDARTTYCDKAGEKFFLSIREWDSIRFPKGRTFKLVEQV